LSAWSIGRTAALAREQKQDVAQAIAESCGGSVIFRGKIDIVSRWVEESMSKGSCTIEPIVGGDPETREARPSLRLFFINEIMEARLITPGKADEILSIVPDVISILDASTGASIGITEIRYGLRVSILAMRGADIWYTPAGLERVGPKEFG
jgi:uncharacterized protein